MYSQFPRVKKGYRQYLMIINAKMIQIPSPAALQRCDRQWEAMQSQGSLQSQCYVHGFRNSLIVHIIYSNISRSSDVRSISRWGQRRKNVPHHCPRVWAQSHVISYNHISSFCLVTDPASERLQVKSLRHAPRTCSGSTTLTSNKRWTIEPVSHIVPWS